MTDADGSDLPPSGPQALARESPHGHRAHARAPGQELGAAVLTVSTRCAAGEQVDRTGPAIVEAICGWGLEIAAFETVSDDRAAIAERLEAWSADAGIRLVVTTGGTGLSPTDVTPEATDDVIDRAVPGIAESIRARGLAATPLAALSRGIAGLAGDTLIVNLPGSPGGVRDGLAVLEAVVVHALETADED